MGVPDLVDGHLPMGRWVCSAEEVEAAFVTSDTGVRPKMWADWLTLRDALREVVGQVAACWLSGSFFTSKAVPGDIDCLWIVESDRIQNVLNSGDPQRAQFLHNVATAGSVKQVYKLEVDSFLLPWAPRPGAGPPVDPESQAYISTRGYWDNLWVRRRDQDPRLDSIPRRGYLEVTVDGYA